MIYNAQLMVGLLDVCYHPNGRRCLCLRLFGGHLYHLCLYEASFEGPSTSQSQVINGQTTTRGGWITEDDYIWHDSYLCLKLYHDWVWPFISISHIGGMRIEAGQCLMSAIIMMKLWWWWHCSSCLWSWAGFVPCGPTAHPLPGVLQFDLVLPAG